MYLVRIKFQQSKKYMGWKNAEIENTIFGTIDWGMSAAGLTFRTRGLDTNHANNNKESQHRLQ